MGPAPKIPTHDVLESLVKGQDSTSYPIGSYVLLQAHDTKMSTATNNTISPYYTMGRDYVYTMLDCPSRSIFHHKSNAFVANSTSCTVMITKMFHFPYPDMYI